MWPMHLDMTRDECKRVLRRFELEAYSTTVSALRAQGELNTKKRKLLQDLASQLNISMERHKAEVRRAVNDEKLTTIAEFMGGPHTATDWEVEGRRLIPLMPRLVPQTAFTALANNVANITAAENAKLPTPATTAKKTELTHDHPSHREPSIPEASRTPVEHTSMPAVPSATVSPAGSSHQLNDEEESAKKRRLSPFEESRPSSPAVPTLKIPATTSHSQQPRKTVAFPVNMAPIKVPPCRTTTSSQASSTQKVIIVSSPANSGSPSILQRSLSVPVVKTVAATSSSNTATQQRASSLIINPTHTSASGSSSVSNIVTISTNQGTTGTITAKAVPVESVHTTAYITPTSSISKGSPKNVMFPNKVRPRTSSIMIPMTRNQVPLSVSSVQRPVLRATRPHLQAVKQDIAPFKLLPATYTTTKILPKPTPPSASIDPPVSSGNTSATTVITTTTTTVGTTVMQARTMPTNMNSRLITVNTSIAPVSAGIPKQPGKSLSTVHVSALSPGMKTTSDKNVFLVQKSGPMSYSRGIPLTPAGKETLGKLVLSKNFTAANINQTLTPVTVPKPVASCKTIPPANNQHTIHLPGSAVPGNVLMIDLSNEKMGKNSLLADILQASGIFGEGSTTGDTSQSDEGPTVNIQLSTEEESQNDLSEEVEIATSNEVVICEDPEKIDITDDVSETADDTSPSRVVTLEEAVTLLGHSDCAETRALLRQAGIEVTDALPTVDTSHSQGLLDNSIHRVVHEEDVVSAGHDSIMEMIGELDPQTGVYSIHSTTADNQLKADTNQERFSSILQPLTFPSGSTGQVPTATKENVYLKDELGNTTSKDEQEHVSSIMQPMHSRQHAAVTVEPNHMDTSEMHLEDFTSQKAQSYEL